MRISPRVSRLSLSVWRFSKACPVTAAVIVIAVGLWLAVIAERFFHPDHAADALRRLGAVSNLVYLNQSGSTEELNLWAGLSGPFALWDGEVWRILVSAFHHGGFLHLALNLLGIAFMGDLLEPRMRRVSYALFFLVGTFVSMLPEYFCASINWLPEVIAGGFPVGLSGGAYAMFGMLLVLRKRDEEVAEVIHENVVIFGIAWMFGCIVLSVFDILHIANLAHFTGFAYGWIAGHVVFGKARLSRVARWGFLAAHTVVILVVYFLVHPVWNGSYHWYLAKQAMTRQERIYHAERTTECNPGLRGPWIFLAVIYSDRGETQHAWETVLKGLYFNRTDDQIVKLGREIWRHFKTPDEQRQALETLNDIFREDALVWQNQLVPLPAITGNPMFGFTDINPPTIPGANADRSRGLSPSDWDGGFSRNGGLQKHDLRAPAVNPDSPESAAEGTSL